MAFSEAQTRALGAKLNARHIRSRAANGETLCYLEGWHAMAEANRIFGFAGWDRETVEARCVWQAFHQGQHAAAYLVRVRIRVRAGEALIIRDGSGAGEGRGATPGEAHENGLKAAETDATKRALATFGNPFGLALYDPERRHIRGRPRKVREPQPASWPLHVGDGERPQVFQDPVAFYAAFRKRLEAVTSLERLQGLLRHNAEVLQRLRHIAPELTTGRGQHYSAVIEALIAGRREALLGGGVPSAGDAASDRRPVDKASLAIGEPRRRRDKAHVLFVASQPCLVCGRRPAQAHHLTFAQPKALSKKAGDDWTVPLCALHHRELHDAGDERQWWRAKRIDAASMASELWRRRQNGPDGDAAEHSAAVSRIQ